MTKLSVNVNKIATLRNARGGNVPIHDPMSDIYGMPMCMSCVLRCALSLT